MPPDGSAAGERARRTWARVECVILAVLIALFVARGFLPGWRRLNTDFPNYYVAARLFVAGAPLERMYDWLWFERQKDHLGLDWGVVSYGPLTPFSALVLAPLAPLSALAAKRCWLALNVVLLGAVVAMLGKMTRLGLRRVLILTFLTVVPLRTSFDFGQQHLLVLFLVTLAAWLHARDRERLAGAVVALASVLKIAPAVFAVFFVLKRRWGALASFLGAAVACAGAGVLLVGVEPLRVYATYVLPRVSAGEVHDPYYVGVTSVTTLLRRLLVAEPDLNPHPLLAAPAAYAVLQPVVQTLLLTSGLALLVRRRGAPDAWLWGGFAALSLVLSTGASTYHLTLLILSTVVAVDALVTAGRPRLAIALVVLHAVACTPLERVTPVGGDGWRALLGAPRLYALLVYSGVFAAGLTTSAPSPRGSWEPFALLASFLGLSLSGALSARRHVTGAVETYATRLSVGGAGGGAPSLLATEPAALRDGLVFTRMDREGYSLGREDGSTLALATRGIDLFHPTVARETRDTWVEVASRESRVARVPSSGASVAADLATEIGDAEQPSASADGRWLGFVREESGRGALWLLDRRSGRGAFEVGTGREDVLDLCLLPDGRAIVATARADVPQLFVVAPSAAAPWVALGVAGRWPAVSPDGARLAYSRPEHGAWQLVVMDLATHETRTLTHAECNSTTPTFTDDGARIVFASDCGRGLGATALATVPAPRLSLEPSTSP